MQSHLISNASSQEAAYYQAIDMDEKRERALETMQVIVLNDIQSGDPQTCSAFAEYCAENMSTEVTLALCLSRIHRDAGLQKQAIAELNAQVDKLQHSFLAVEVERRIKVQLAQAEAQAMAALELDHA